MVFLIRRTQCTYRMQRPQFISVDSSLRPSESTVHMLVLQIWVGLSLLLTTVLGRPLNDADSALGKCGVVGTGYVSYQGVETFGDVTSYLGIPYAEPPLGDLRFRAPKPLDVARVASEAAGNVVDATQYPDFCVQGPIFRKYLMTVSDTTFTQAGTGGDRGGAGSEDCLKVNIYAPSNAKAGSNRGSEFFVLLCRRGPHASLTSARVILHSRGGLCLRKPRHLALRSLGPPEPRSRHCLRLLSSHLFRIPLPP
jgi:hypothetical protein